MILAVALSLALQVAPSPQAESLFGPPEPVQAYTDDEPRCVRDGSTLELNVCVLEDLRAEEARMQRYFDVAMTRASEGDAESGQFGGERTQQTAWLQASQTAWVAYVESRCAGVFDQWKDGTIRTIVSFGCRIEATRQRTHDIWEDHLTYWDSTPPLLPEPVRTVWEEAQGEASSAAPAARHDTTG
ncbi:lysozyme inhibitor LprI family protein [Brevundimonas sp. FT23028]|uniref:lysozyme inhibitor LprI family protein n=1 Tax=Brevundimonas sp. FT23028 TaxID=3393748 RepID=UPI003B58AA21